MITKRIRLLMIIITGSLLLASYISREEEMYLVIPEKDKTVDNFNPTSSRSDIKDGGVVKKSTTKDKHDRQNIIKNSDSVEHSSSKHTHYTNVTDSKNTTVIKPQVKEKIVIRNSNSNNENHNSNTIKDEEKVSVDIVDNDIKKDPEIPKDNSPEIKQPPIEKDFHC